MASEFAVRVYARLRHIRFVTVARRSLASRLREQV